MDTTTHSLPSIVLVPGHWLGAWAWDDVADDLRLRGHQVTAVTLPGLERDDPERASRTVAQQAEALEVTVHAAPADGRPSSSSPTAGLVPPSQYSDQEPTAIARVIYVDSGPSSDGSAFDANVAPDAGEVPLPPFEDLAAGGASLEGLSEDDLERFRARAVPGTGTNPNPATTARHATAHALRVAAHLLVMDACRGSTRIVRQCFHGLIYHGQFGAPHPCEQFLARRDVSRDDYPAGVGRRAQPRPSALTI